MNTARPRRAGALLLVTLCFAFFGTHALAVPAILSQPKTRTETPSAPITWHARGPPSPVSSLHFSPIDFFFTNVRRIYLRMPAIVSR